MIYIKKKKEIIYKVCIRVVRDRKGEKCTRKEAPISPAGFKHSERSRNYKMNKLKFDFRGNPATSGKVFYFDGSSVFRKTI